MSECPLAWTPEKVRKFINEYDEDYEIVECGVAWDVEYVYVILCEEMLLLCYYKGITTDATCKWDIQSDCGDELIIPDNIFTTEKPKEETKKLIWKSVNKKEQYPPCLTRWMDEYGKAICSLYKQGFSDRIASWL